MEWRDTDEYTIMHMTGYAKISTTNGLLVMLLNMMNILIFQPYYTWQTTTQRHGA